MPDRFEDRYEDVLQNIEFAIVSVYRQYPELSDANVDRVIEGLIRIYTAEVNQRPVPALKLNELDQSVFASVRAICEWRLGRSDASQTDLGKVKPEPKTPEEIIACLKRIRLSIRRWTGQGGRQGYLLFVSQYIP
ncbi:MAG: hypothetical protein ACYDBJ_07340 [Aggregatilineales bacterium]